MERKIKLKAHYWNQVEEEDSNGQKKLFIYIGGLNEEQKTVHVKVHGFTPFVYLELPRKISWNKMLCEKLYRYLKDNMRNCCPVSFAPCSKYNLYGKHQLLTIRFSFESNLGCYYFAKFMSQGRIIPGVGSFSKGDFKVHEHNIDPIIKFTALKKIKLAGWIEIKEKILEDEKDLDVEERKFTTADVDCHCDWKDVQPIEAPEGVLIRHKYLFYDIECNSENHNSKIPDPALPENCICQISVTVGRVGTKERTRYLLTLGSPLEIKDTTVFTFKKEGQLLLKFSSLVREHDPDIIGGYNIMKFDWSYMIDRAEVCGVYPKFAEIGRLLGKRMDVVEKSWSSSAYGTQKFKYPDIQGRTNVDVMVEVERNYKLPSYSLNVVAGYFLKSSKEDLSPKQLFMLFQLQRDLTPRLEKCKTKGELLAIRSEIRERLPLRKISGCVITLRNDLLACRSKTQMLECLRGAMTYIGIYCVKDTDITIDVFDKLNLWTTMEEMSNCTNVPISYLHTRGQQIKVLCQVYRQTMAENILIPFREKSKTQDDSKYQGATVIDAPPGDHLNVSTCDFASLYPSIMMTGNMCYTTFVPDGDEFPDEKCNVFEWEDHKNCIHDPKRKKGKIKEDTVLCKKNRYRFKKVIFHPDGTIENEGLMPRLVRNLLSERKKVKKEMEKLEAMVKMTKGLATEKEIEEYKKYGYKIVEKGSIVKRDLELLEVNVQVLNARQLALKVSANSAYGTLGAKTGYIPLVPAAACVTAVGRNLIRSSIDYILKNYRDAEATLVYGDTDSCMIRYKKWDLRKTFEMSPGIAKQVTHFLKTTILKIDENYSFILKGGKNVLLKNVTDDDLKLMTNEDKCLVFAYRNIAISLAFECVYGRYIQMTKKRYIAQIVTIDGKVEKEVKKGVVLARRDNCGFLRVTYKEMIAAIMANKSKDEIFGILYDRISKLFTRQIPDPDLIIYIGIKDVMEYAKKKVTKKPFSDQNPFVDENGEFFNDPIGPLDPRLVYRNMPQTLLALKMLRRGDIIPANTRLEMIYIENDDAVYQGDRAEDYLYYWENKTVEKLRPDYLHYLNKQLAKPITELLNVKFPPEEIKFVSPEEAFEMEVKKCSELIRTRITGYMRYEKIIHCPKKCLDGCRACRKQGPRKYTSKKLEAQVDYILDCLRKEKQGPNDISLKKHRPLIEAARLLKSIFVLDRVHRKHGLRKRTWIKPKKGQTTYFRDEGVMANIIKYREAYRDVVDKIHS